MAIESASRMRFEPGNCAVGVHQSGPLGHRDQGADVVEQVDEQEDEDDLDQGDAKAAFQVQGSRECPA